MSSKAWLLFLLLLATGVIYTLFQFAASVHDAGETSPSQMISPSPILGAASKSNDRARGDGLSTSQRKVVDGAMKVADAQDSAMFGAIASDGESLIQLKGEQTLVHALDEAVAKYGSSDPKVAQAVADATEACRSEPDPFDAVGMNAHDPTRDWAIKRILNLCRGFDRSKFHLNAPPVSDVGIVKSQVGTASAVRQAFEEIATSQRAHSLIQAGILLFETNKFPYKEVLPNGRQEYGQGDLGWAWILAVRLVLCQERGPCGPYSLQVAVFCRKNGCPPGIDLASAYKCGLSPHLFRAVMAFTQWLVQERVPYQQ